MKFCLQCVVCLAVLAHQVVACLPRTAPPPQERVPSTDDTARDAANGVPGVIHPPGTTSNTSDGSRNSTSPRTDSFRMIYSNTSDEGTNTTHPRNSSDYSNPNRTEGYAGYIKGLNFTKTTEAANQNATDLDHVTAAFMEMVANATTSPYVPERNESSDLEKVLLELFS